MRWGGHLEFTAEARRGDFTCVQPEQVLWIASRWARSRSASRRSDSRGAGIFTVWCPISGLIVGPGRTSWARLLKRVFDIDWQHCPNCGSGGSPPELRRTSQTFARSHRRGAALPHCCEGGLVRHVSLTRPNSWLAVRRLPKVAICGRSKAPAWPCHQNPTALSPKPVARPKHFRPLQLASRPCLSGSRVLKLLCADRLSR